MYITALESVVCIEFVMTFPNKIFVCIKYLYLFPDKLFVCIKYVYFFPYKKYVYIFIFIDLYNYIFKCLNI